MSDTKNTPTKDQKGQSISGYIANVSELLSSKPKDGGKVTKYFDFQLYTRSEKKRGVCFSPQKRKYLARLSEEKKGVTMKKVRVAKNILVNADSSVIETTLDFEKAEPEIVISSISDTLYVKEIHDYVDIKVKLCEISELFEQNTTNGILIIRNAVAIDDSEHIPISIFGALTKTVRDGGIYQITQCSIGTFLGDRTLKTTANSVMTRVGEFQVDANATVANTDVIGKVCQIDKSTFLKTYTCKTCKSTLSENNVEDDILLCPNCDSLFCAMDCVDEVLISFTFMESKSKKRHTLSAKLKILLDAYQVKDNTDLPKAMLTNEIKIVLRENKILSIGKYVSKEQDDGSASMQDGCEE